MTGAIQPPASDAASASIQDAGEHHRAGTLLAFDFGTERIGVAVGEATLRTAHPLTTIAAAGASSRFAAIEGLIREWQPSRLLVGVPVHMDATEHEMTARARRFARQLYGRFGIPVELVDERLSTQEAASMLQSAGVNAKRQKPVRDQVAAQDILQGWMNRHER